MDSIESCKHRWSVRKRIYITQSHWIEVEHCRKKCQQDRQVEYKNKLVNGQLRTESTITPIRHNKYDENESTIQPIIPDRSSTELSG